MRAYFGPNPYAPFPVIVADIGCGLADDANVVRVRQRMEKAFPGWMDGCPRTLALAPAHALAEIAAHWSKSLLNSVRGLVEGAGTKLGETGCVELWVGFHVPQITATAIEMSTRMVRSAIADPDPFPAARLEQDVVQLQSICRREHPDYIARILMLAARAANIPVLPSPIGHRHWQYGWGCNGRTFFEACAVGESITGYRIAGNKALTTRFLKSMGFPVTAHLLANTVDEALLHARALGWPLVVKPIDRGQGRGVTVGIRSEEAIVHAFAVARQFTSEPILVERFVEGCDHRLLVVRGRLVAAVRREPATVVGDGASTVRELIAGLNAYRQSQPHLARYLKMVKEEAEVLDHLASQGLNPDSVPAVGRSVPLRGNANVSSGGSPTDVLHAVHPEVRSLVESIAVNLGLESVGVDYITADISRSLSDAPGCVIEVNVTPGLDLHIAASMREEEIGRIVLGSALGRIPVVLVVASIKDQRQLLNELQRRGTSLGPGTAMVGPDGTRVDLLQLEAGTLSFP